MLIPPTPYYMYLEASRALRRTGRRIERNLLCSVFSSWEHQWTTLLIYSSEQSRFLSKASSSAFLSSSRPRFSNWSYPSDRQVQYKMLSISLCSFFTSGLHGKATLQLLPVCCLQEGYSSPFINGAGGRARLNSRSVCKAACQRYKQRRCLLPLLDLPKCGCLITEKALATCPGEALLKFRWWCVACGLEYSLHLTALCALKIFLPALMALYLHY